LAAYNLKKLYEQTWGNKKRMEGMETFHEKFDSDLEYRAAAEEEWREFWPEELEEGDVELLGNLDNFTLVDVHDRVEEITEEYDAFLEGKSLLDNVNPGKLKEQRSLRKDAERAEEVWLDFTSYFEEEFGEEYEEVTEEAEQWVEDSVPSMAA